MKSLSLKLALLTLLLLNLSCNSQVQTSGVDAYLSSFKMGFSATLREVDHKSLSPLAHSPFSGKDIYPVMKHPLANDRILTVLIEPNGDGGMLQLEVLKDRETVFNQCIAEFSFGAWLILEFDEGKFSTTIIMGDFAQFTKHRIEENSISCIGLAQIFE